MPAFPPAVAVRAEVPGSTTKSVTSMDWLPLLNFRPLPSCTTLPAM